jgi:BASS family bile acid:Na+ symporter
MEFTSYSYIDIVISGVLALIMFGIGISLTFSSFKNIFISPKSLLIGLFAQMIVLPSLVFCIVYFVDIPLSFKVGFMILASCPGGTTSGFLTYFFKGNVALSISLTSINSIITLFSIPFIVNLGLNAFLGKSTTFHLPYLETIIQIFIVAIIPAAFGILLRKNYEGFAKRIQKPLNSILIVLLALIFIIKLFANEKHGGTGITEIEILQILPIALVINVLAFSSGYLISQLLKLNLKTAYTVGVEVAMQNTTLAFLVASALLRNQEMVKPAIIYSMFSFWSAIVFTFIVKYFNKVKLINEFND